MPSMRSDAWPRQAGTESIEPIALMLLTAAQAPALLHAIGVERMGVFDWLVTAALALGAAGAARVGRRTGKRWAHMLVYMLLFGNLGMIAGAWLDFGSDGLVALTHWCHMHPGLAPADILAKLRGAPWSYGLMLLGCNLGMLLSDRLWRTHEVSRMVQRAALVHWRQHALAIRCYAACNAGMLVGMLLAEGGMPGGHHHHVETGAVLAMVMVMAFGMTAGMLLGWWASMRGPLLAAKFRF